MKLCFACNSDQHIYKDCTNEEAKKNLKKHIKNGHLSLKELNAAYNKSNYEKRFGNFEGTFSQHPNNFYCPTDNFSANPVLIPLQYSQPYYQNGTPFNCPNQNPFNYPNQIPFNYQESNYQQSYAQDNSLFVSKKAKFYGRLKRRRGKKSPKSSLNQSKDGFDVNNLDRKIKRKKNKKTITLDELTDMEISSDLDISKSKSSPNLETKDLKIKFNDFEFKLNQNNSYFNNNMNETDKLTLISLRDLVVDGKELPKDDELELNDNEKIDYKEFPLLKDDIFTINDYLFGKEDQDYRNILGNEIKIQQKNVYNTDNKATDEKLINDKEIDDDKKSIDGDKETDDDKKLAYDKEIGNNKIEIDNNKLLIKRIKQKIDEMRKEIDNNENFIFDIGEINNEQEIGKNNKNKIDQKKIITKQPFDETKQKINNNQQIDKKIGKQVDKKMDKQINKKGIKECEEDDILIVDRQNSFYLIMISPLTPVFENEFIIRSKFCLSSFLSSSSLGITLFKNLKFKMEVDFSSRKKKLIFLEYYAKHKNKNHFDIKCLPIDEDKFDNIITRFKRWLIEYKSEQAVDKNSIFFDSDLKLDKLNKKIGDQSYFLVLYGENSGFIYKFRDIDSEKRFKDDWLEKNVYHYLNFKDENIALKLQQINERTTQKLVEQKSRCDELIKILGAKKN